MKQKITKTLGIFLAFIMLASTVPSVNTEAKTVTTKYKKQVNKIMKATELYYELKLTYKMKKGKKKKIKLTDKEKMQIAAGYDIARNSSSSDGRITNAAFSQRVKKLFGTKAKIKLLPSYGSGTGLVTRYGTKHVQLTVGDWGSSWPVYKLKSIKKKGKTYTAVYKFWMDDDWGGHDPLGKVTLKLKKTQKSAYGFYITGITIKKYK